jgi:hypothetical protein
MQSQIGQGPFRKGHLRRLGVAVAARLIQAGLRMASASQSLAHPHGGQCPFHFAGRPSPCLELRTALQVLKDGYEADVGALQSFSYEANVLAGVRWV